MFDIFLAQPRALVEKALWRPFVFGRPQWFVRAQRRRKNAWPHEIVYICMSLGLCFNFLKRVKSASTRPERGV